MFKFPFQKIIFAVIFSTAALHLSAQQVKEPKADSAWVQPYEPFRIAGNLYYVGTYDLACYLITTTKGNILINTGLASSAAQIKSNIETLGFRFADTKILLTTQAHYDHMGAMSAIKKATGAKLYVDEADASVLATGGSSDYALGKYGVSFQPVKPDRLLHNNDSIHLGKITLQMLHHPGHTKGSCSFLFAVKDGQRNYKVLVANMPSIVIDEPFNSVAAYPGIAADYASTFKAMKNISFDIWVASHASQFNLHKKRQLGDAYNPAAFIDQAGYDAELNNLQKQYEEKLAKDNNK